MYHDDYSDLFDGQLNFDTAIKQEDTDLLTNTCDQNIDIATVKEEPEIFDTSPQIPSVPLQTQISPHLLKLNLQQLKQRALLHIQQQQQKQQQQLQPQQAVKVIQQPVQAVPSAQQQLKLILQQQAQHVVQNISAQPVQQLQVPVATPQSTPTAVPNQSQKPTPTTTSLQGIGQINVQQLQQVSYPRI